ncbi:TetR family transcriptional regulator [Kribbella sp. VKM Ac-2527]|uniref:TetR family transcriptional regulator n=1 Tax=Kribbella caucasensis TaxID=2512215 RepID=A0A4V3C5G7_9ACTN|nr:TetR/AcrR family transcriptional regulator [Kribbella sp. VKM Ac-2527]TDO29868.1 TetR family transcriptional regulator [Kribbella sp. VKM Ac-2527]
MNQKAAKSGNVGPRHRSDAERSIEAILDATLKGILAGDDVKMAVVARAAGVSRVTLYSHFPTREALLEASVDRAIAHAKDLVSELNLDQGPAPEALSRLLGSHWQTLDRYRSLYLVAASSLPPERLRALHTPLFGRIKTLIARGQADGDFRTDLSRDWLVATVFGLMHQAAEEVAAQRLPVRKAGDVVTTTVLSVFICA